MANLHFISRNSCPCCDSGLLKQLYEAPYDRAPLSDYLNEYYKPQGGVDLEYLIGATYVLAECADCGLVFQQTVPDDFLLQRLYDFWIDADKQFEIYERHHPLVHYRNLAHEMMLLGTYFAAPPDTLKVFDFGMGWGDWCRMAAAFGFDAFGGELSKKRIAHASRFGVRIIDWESIPGANFDFIHTEQVFEHLTDPKRMLGHLVTGLRPGGLIYIGVPDGADVLRRLAAMNWKASKGSADALHVVAPLEHLNCFRHQSLVRLARDAGLAEIEFPRKLQYAAQSDWTPLKPMLKNLLRPFLNNHLNVGTSLYFRKPA